MASPVLSKKSDRAPWCGFRLASPQPCTRPNIGGDDQSLPEPKAVRAVGSKVTLGTAPVGRLRRFEQRINSDGAGEPFGRSLR
jgi:hypothetical protein